MNDSKRLKQLSKLASRSEPVRNASRDDVLGFEKKLRRLIEEAVEAAEQFEINGEWRKDGIAVNRCAYVLGYIMAPAQFSQAERAALDARIHGALSSSDTGAKR